MGQLFFLWPFDEFVLEIGVQWEWFEKVKKWSEKV